MRKYETIIISDPDLQDQSRADLLDKVRNIIARENGILLYVDDWGSKKLAYEISKKLRGHYVCLTYGAPETWSRSLNETWDSVMMS